MKLKVLVSLAILVVSAPLFAQKKPDSPADSVRKHLASVDRRLLEMAQDFPEDKYDFKLKPEMRSFGEVLVHLVSGNIYATQKAKGDSKAEWGELDAKKYPNKADIVALIEKEFAASEAALKALPDNAFNKPGGLDPYLSVTDHNSEHYGLLVAYYRANGLVPPASRPKK
jgi:DinB superfamily